MQQLPEETSGRDESKVQQGEESVIRPIVHDPLFLAQKSAPAKKADLPIVTDLMDTLKANLDHCVGMAANMIGEKKRIIVVCNGPIIMPMLNPKILSKTGEYETEEGCLSLAGVRRTKRYETIRISWQDPSMKEHVEMMTGFVAQIVQHEIFWRRRTGENRSDAPACSEGGSSGDF